MANKVRELGLTYADLGSIYIKLNLLEKANESYNQALSIFGAESDTKETAAIFEALGTIQKLSNNTAAASDYWTKALDKYRAINDTEHYNQQIEALLNLIGLACLEQRQFDYAISSFEQILELYSDLGETAHTSTAAAYRHLGEVYLAKGNLNEANLSLTKAQDMYRALGLGALSAEVALLLQRTQSAPLALPIS